MPALPELSVSEFLALVNQTLEFAYPGVTIIGELANFRIARNQWLYFDLKDEDSSVKFFGTVYQLPGPLEDGLLLKVHATPRLHQKYGFSLNVLSIEPAGEGSIKRAASLLEAKLAGEGLFDQGRKRQLSYPPAHIGLITSLEAAAYTDFIKVLGARWSGLEILVIDVQVQGELAAGQIVRAIEQLNSQPQPPEVLVITRGGGSAEDLQAFNTEVVVRAVAASRIPTLVAVGHERDVSLAELGADQRASTPSNAAELLVPERANILKETDKTSAWLTEFLKNTILESKEALSEFQTDFKLSVQQQLSGLTKTIESKNQVLAALNPNIILDRGYVLLRKQGKLVRRAGDLAKGDLVDITLQKGRVKASIESVRIDNG